MITFYKIYCLDENIIDCYIGSTKIYSRRKKSHYSTCDNINASGYNYKVYKFIRENGGFDNWDFKVLNEVKFYGKELQLKMEQTYIDYYKPNLNVNHANRSKQQYRQDNIEKISEDQKEYYQKNKEKLNEYRRDNKEKTKEYRNERQKKYNKNNKEKKSEYQKEYCMENKDKIINYQKIYREKNKEKLAEYDRQRYQKKKESNG